MQVSYDRLSLVLCSFGSGTRTGKMREDGGQRPVTIIFPDGEIINGEKYEHALDCLVK